MALKFQQAEKKCIEKVQSLRLLVFKPKLEQYCCSLWCFPAVFHHRAALALDWNRSSGYWFTLFSHVCWTLHLRMLNNRFFLAPSSTSNPENVSSVTSCLHYVPFPSFGLQGPISKMGIALVPSSPGMRTANNLHCWLWSSEIPKTQISLAMERKIGILRTQPLMTPKSMWTS